MVLTPSLSLMSPCGPRFPRGLPRARAPVFSGVIAYGPISGLSASGSRWRQMYSVGEEPFVAGVTRP